jgi:HD-GYP domain-containing protein (c-di-GMP phosphodiesterase class II)
MDLCSPGNSDAGVLRNQNLELQAENERLHNAINTMLDGFALLRAVRDESGQIIEFYFEEINEAGCQMRGHPRNELIGHAMFEEWPHRREMEIFRDCVQVVETGEPLTKEIMFYHDPTGNTPSSYEIYDVHATKNGDGLTATWRDVKKQKQQEDEIRRLNTELAQRVTDQTTQLKQMVQELTGQIAEREQNAARAEALAHIAARLNARLDLNTVQKTICEESAAALHFPVAVIALLDPATQALSVTATHGMPTDYQISERIRYIDTYMRMLGVENLHEPPIIDDLQAYTALPEAQRIKGLGLRTVVGVGMFREKELIGALALISIGEVHPVSQHDFALLKSLADPAALAISNARLYEEEQERTTELSALLSLSSCLRESQSTDVMLPALLREIHALLKVDACMVALLHSPAQGFVIVQTEGFLSDNQNMPLQPDEGIFGIVMASGEPYITKDYASEPTHLLQLQNGDKIGPAVFIPIRHETGRSGALVITRMRSETAHPFTPAEIRLVITVGEMLGTALRKVRLFDDLQQANTELMQAYDDTIKGWSHALDLRDKETEDHTQRVTDLTEILAQALGVQGEELIHIRRGAILHDIGKMGIPDSILLKPGPLTNEEWAIMRLHPQYAYEMLLPIQYLRPALDIPYCHHEWWNGNGYPRGLRGEQIPLAARIFAVVDVWDALSFDRPYRKAWPKHQVRAYLLQRAGSQFDPTVVHKFLEIMDGAVQTTQGASPT